MLDHVKKKQALQKQFEELRSDIQFFNHQVKDIGKGYQSPEYISHLKQAASWLASSLNSTQARLNQEIVAA